MSKSPDRTRDATIAATTVVLSARSVILPAPDRGDDLQVRVSVPAVGNDVPVIVFSHGVGSSMDGYLPLVDYWTAHGFAVIQPTHLDAKRLALASDDPRAPDFCKFRVEDIKRVLDNLDLIEGALPGLRGRLNRDRIAAAGHSFGGFTTSLLLGARLLDARGEPQADMSDRRITAGVLLAAAGTGGKDLSPFAAEHFAYMNPGFSEMATPTLVVAGDKDVSSFTVRGPDWFTDPYSLSPGRKCLLTLSGGEHMLGGISGYDVTETTDENPDRVALVQRMTSAFLRSELCPGDHAWEEACVSIEQESGPAGRVECKSAA